MAAIRGRAGLSLFGIGAFDPAFPGYIGYIGYIVRKTQ
jgi:hypothetical protein